MVLLALWSHFTNCLPVGDEADHHCCLACWGVCKQQPVEADALVEHLGREICREQVQIGGGTCIAGGAGVARKVGSVLSRGTLTLTGINRRPSRLAARSAAYDS